MRLISSTTVLVCCFLTLHAPAEDNAWIEFENQTADRLPTALNNPQVTTLDPEEKDYAWGDVDNDGDIDLIVVRKQPWSTTGKRVNILLMNEGIAEGHATNGVLVDRTATYAINADVEDDLGFLTPTNDRDVALADVNGDGWLDIITATAQTDNEAKHISHPRVYINQQNDRNGAWLGFTYEAQRIPQMHPTAGPRFGSVSVGDVTGDGSPDLYFTDYDTGGAQIFDYNNKLLINDGSGVFADESELRMTQLMLQSGFGSASAIADMNNDGVADVVKVTTVFAPVHAAIVYNDPDNVGFFSDYDPFYHLAPVYASVGHLDDDGLLDIVMTDDNSDRYLLGSGLDASNFANFLQFIIPQSLNFGGNSLITDLDGDGRNDVLIADVDMELPGCSRHLQIYRNTGENTALLANEPVIPEAMRAGTHDIAVFDINGDGRQDIVVGRCGSTEVWIQLAPCDADINDSDAVDVGDLLAVLNSWGACQSCAEDIDGDGLVGVLDLLTVLAEWGPCQ